MNMVRDLRLVERLSAIQRGVFSKADLQTALAERHPATFVRCLRTLEQHGVLRRFIRGWYVTNGFHLPTLSQRIAPSSYVSFGTVLARELLTGANPERQVMAVKVGRPRLYVALGYQILHLGSAALLPFGYHVIDGVRYADAEKAVLDVLYYHLRGQRYVFDLYSDIRLDTLDRSRLNQYLTHYNNPKFVTFAKGYLGLS